mgnify:CR=1 FL=1
MMCGKHGMAKEQTVLDGVVGIDKQRLLVGVGETTKARSMCK